MTKSKLYPQTILFRDFVCNYFNILFTEEVTNRIPEPLEIIAGSNNFLFCVDHYRGNLEDFKKFVSKEIYEAEVDKFGVNDKTGRIFVVISAKGFDWE